MSTMSFDTLRWIVLNNLLKFLNQGILTTYSHMKTSSQLMTQDKGLLQTKWYHFRQARVFAFATLTTVFQKWHHLARYKHLDKAHARQMRQHRRCKLDAMMQEANEAHKHHDSYKLYRIVQKHCPKQKLKRIRLQNAQGAFLTPVEETAEYCRFIAEKWSGPQMVIPQMNPPGIPFTLEELEIATSNIPGTKAVAPPFAPGVVWKSQAHFIAPWLYSKITQNPSYRRYGVMVGWPSCPNPTKQLQRSSTSEFWHCRNHLERASFG